MSGKLKQSTNKKKIDPKTLKPQKYLDPKAKIIREGKCYTVEEYYGKDDNVQKKQIDE